MRHFLSLLFTIALASPAAAQHLLAEFTYSQSTHLSTYNGPQDSLEFAFAIRPSVDAAMINTYTTNQEGQTIDIPSDLVAKFQTALQSIDPWIYTSVKLSCENTQCSAGYGGQTMNYPVSDHGPIHAPYGTAEMTFIVAPSPSLWTITSMTQTLDAIDVTIRPDLDPDRVNADGYGAYTMRFFGTAPGIVPEPASWLLLMMGLLHGVTIRYRCG